jgi:uncharacterized membrane protein YfcA
LLPVTAALVVVALSALGAFVQGATGLGYGLVVAPALIAALEPRQALFATLASAFVLNVLMLVRSGRPHVRRRGAATVLAWAVPGFVVGAAILRGIARSHLQVAVGVVVIVAVLARAWHPGVLAPGPRRTAARVAAGFSAGLLTTTVSASGPPLALWMDAEGATPREFRDTLNALFGVCNVAGLLVLALDGPPHARTVAITVLLLPGLVGGLVLGRRVAPRLTPTAARRLALAVVGTTGVASVLAGLL